MDIGKDADKVADSIISAYFRAYDLVRHQKESFDSFITDGICQIVKESGDINVVDYNIRFGDISLSDPGITEASGVITPLLPREARLRGCTYASSMYVDVISEKTGEASTNQSLYIGMVPVMLQSVRCPLHRSSPAKLRKAGECEFDRGGYFIINGVERVIIAQETVPKNRTFVSLSNDSFVAAISSEKPNRSRRTLSLRLPLHKSSESVGIQCTIPFIRSEIPIVIVFRALGVSCEKEMLQLMCHDLSDKEMTDSLWDSFEDAKECRTQEVALEFIEKRCARDCSHASDILKREMLPHLGEPDKWAKKKAYYLGYMIHRLLLCALGRMREDDKDHFGNKRLELAGPLFGDLFRKLFRNLTRSITTYVQKCAEANKEVNLELAFMAKTVTNGFNYALSTGNWGMGNGNDKRVGVSQILNRLNYLSSLSHLRRSNSSLRPEGKLLVKPRQLHATQWGLMCPVETPKGDSCGLVKNLALMAYVTLGTATPHIRELLSIVTFDKIEDSYRDIDPYKIFQSTKVFLDGDWIGFHSKDPVLLANYLKKILGEENWECSIIADRCLNEVRINTDRGRVSRPLLTVKVEDQVLILQKKDIKKLDGENVEYGWKSLIRKRFIEYIDAEEEEKTMICISIKDLYKEKANCSFTHCEIHPSLMLGVSASIIPFLNHNQAPRNTYQSSFGKQSIGIYAMNCRNRFDNQSSMLYYPQRPLVNTSNTKHINKDLIPAGINAVVAITNHEGYNQEDALVMNQSSIDRGFFRSLSYRTYKCHETRRIHFGKPPGERMEHLDHDGLPLLGTRCLEEKVIIGRLNTDGLSKDAEVSVKNRRGDHGVVDQVMLTTDPSGYRLAKVKTRVIRTPQIGDKFSSRHGQKGVIGKTTSQEDMPWTVEGITPDIIINPHSLPSRMTIGQLLESVLGKRFATLALKEDIVPFTEATSDNINKILEKCKYPRDGCEKMYEGYTGRPISSMIFIGTVFYQRLAHLVEDKIQSRTRGPVELLTRQPKKGRASYGGIRFGEMERDVLIAHGGALNLKERLFDLSDQYDVHLCSNCGLIGHLKGGQFICRCRGLATIPEGSQVHIPYAFKLLTQELLSMGIGLRLLTKPPTDNQASTSSGPSP